MNPQHFWFISSWKTHITHNLALSGSEFQFPQAPCWLTASLTHNSLIKCLLSNLTMRVTKILTSSTCSFFIVKNVGIAFFFPNLFLGKSTSSYHLARSSSLLIVILRAYPVKFLPVLTGQI